MKNTKKVIYTLTFMLLFLIIGTVKSNAGYLKLNNLDFDVQINDDATMDVTETWDINIRETNTLYKSFKTDSKKYSGITNVTVKEITDGTEINFTKTANWAYHVTKNYYYGTENENGDFEIGWGVGLDNTSATKKYQISYTVTDAVAKYNDFAEVYWQFVGKDFEIDADKITGTIYLPSKVSNIENIRVWGHTEDLNGTIYVTDSNKIEFELNNFRNGRYVEIRTLFPTELINYSRRTKNIDIQQTVIEEETKWAENANAKRRRTEILTGVLIISLITINIVLTIILVKKAKKYSKKNKELKKFTPTTELEYYRDLPDENTTPAEANKILFTDIVTSFTPINFGSVFSATLLDLTLKGFLEITQEKNEKGKETISIKVREEPNIKLKQDEEVILNFVKGAFKGKDTIKLKELENYIKKHTSLTEKMLENTYKKMNAQLVEEQIIDEEMQKEYKKYRDNQSAYIAVAIFFVCCTFFFFAIPTIALIVNAVLCGKVAKKINVLTQKGVDAKEEWKGLKKFMEDFSMLDKREVPELIIWEKYLVYATAFGIADKVIKQLKIVYPNFDEMTSNIETFTYMNLMMNTSFNTSFSHSITSAMSSVYSSGSGGGGGFSGGGGGGRWPVAAEAGR